MIQQKTLLSRCDHQFHSFHSTKMDQNGACQICTPCRGHRGHVLRIISHHWIHSVSSLSKSPRQAHIAPCAVRGAPTMHEMHCVSASATVSYKDGSLQWAIDLPVLMARNSKSNSAGVSVSKPATGFSTEQTFEQRP